jgi:hypothetical protein
VPSGRCPSWPAGWRPPGPLLYAIYRGYYALGGTAGRFGTPLSEGQWRLINGIAAAILLVDAVAPLGLLSARRARRLRPALLALC